MKLEHLALNVSDPVAMAAWYVEHMGCTVAMGLDEAPFTHFIADSGGNMCLEIYNNPPDKVPAYSEMEPLLLHVAFVSDDPGADMERLIAAGADLIEEIHMDDGSYLVSLRDPWGLAIQLCRRTNSLLKDY